MNFPTRISRPSKPLGHVVEINADRFPPADAGLIPTGEIRPVAGTSFDFPKPVPIGQGINDPRDEQIKFGNGYQISGSGGVCRSVAVPGPSNVRASRPWRLPPKARSGGLSLRRVWLGAGLA